MNQRLLPVFHSLLRHRPAVLVIAGLLVLVAGLGALQVRVDFGVEQFFLPAGPERQAFEAYKRTFPREDTRFTLFWQDTRPLGVAMYRDMERAARIFDEVGLEDVQWVGSAVVAESEGSGDDAGLSLEPLIAADAGDALIASRVARHRDDPLLTGFLWDSSQTVYATHGYLDQSRNNDRGRRSVEEALTARIDSLHIERAHLVLGGLPAARSRAPKLLAEDLGLLAAAAVALSGVVLFYFLRNPTQVVLVLASVAPAYLATVGLMGFLGKPISVLTSFIPVVVLVVGMGDAVHLVAEFRRRLVEGRDPADAVARTFAALAVPCWYTSLTTAMGFGSLAGTGIGIVADFGAFTALAILLTYVLTTTLLPVLLSFVERKAFDDRGLVAPWLGWLVTAAVAEARRRSTRIPALFLLVGIGCVALGFELRVNTLLIDDIKEDTAIMRDIRWIEARGFGLFQVAVHLRRTGDQPLHHPDALAWIEQFREFARQEPVVLSTFALTDLVQRVKRSLIPDATAGDLPASAEEAAQLLLMVEMQDANLVRALYAEPEGEAQVILTVRDAGSTEMQPFLARVNGYLAAHPLPGGEAVATGTVTMIQAFTARLLQTLGPSIALAVILIGACMARMFRSLRLGLLAVVANLFPLVVLLGAMALGGFDLKPSTILVFSIAFGIAVDNTIHLLGRFLDAVRYAPSVEAAVVDALRAAGPGLVMNTAVVTTGFALLMASHFQVLFLIGLMTVLSALAALAFNLFAFPSVLAAAWRLAPAPVPVSRPLEEA